MAMPETTREITTAEKDMRRFMQALAENEERKRAMLLSWVDEIERLMGFGEGDKPPRTSQIRKWWREQGEPTLSEQATKNKE